ncbi:DUF2141 domain-containing protein [Chlorogloeopsis sp. ULAP01]|uniref:DUF2141 domain-containing protein n=1 Tax=Chlorogloeopsis sp. ULAP01 TaxID=3056483 RepID=UPI0025AB2A10|nr:DUF2141 domain-containing protein [Chlorogloeopsis sp. ULAP01]MDM9383427.1 DUF2141 domain-containing protein [Chlorogloeopsis sp. ULAP01]
MLLKVSKIAYLLLPALLSMSFGCKVNAEPTSTLTVVVKGIKHQKGQICIRVFSSEKGFPLGSSGEVKSGCTQIAGNYVKKQFTGLKPGTYAVAVVDDQNGDYKLDRDFLGIPKEGFGISKNPTVSLITGTPKFSDASFSLQKNKTINIFMKYGLDP